MRFPRIPVLTEREKPLLAGLFPVAGQSATPARPASDSILVAKSPVVKTDTGVPSVVASSPGGIYSASNNLDRKPIEKPEGTNFMGNGLGKNWRTMGRIESFDHTLGTGRGKNWRTMGRIESFDHTLGTGRGKNWRTMGEPNTGSKLMVGKDDKTPGRTTWEESHPKEAAAIKAKKEKEREDLRKKKERARNMQIDSTFDDLEARTTDLEDGAVITEGQLISINSSISTINSTLADHETRIAALGAASH